MRPKVIIVDDDAPTLAALRRLLKPAFDCEGVGDGEQAQRIIQHNAFDMVLLDLSLPHVDGFQLLAELRQHKPHVPVVILSADARPDTIITAMRRGACDYVVKPFNDVRGLTARLQRAHEQSLGSRTIADLLLVLEDEQRPLPRYSEARQIVLTQFQRVYLGRLMREAGGNLSAASRLSGIDRANLRRALQKLRK
jgi:DNA-binding NtrC family response regulator